ncbi:MAG: hypothetical protein AAF961_09215 [Planctomycetota bacterium]
MKQRSSIAALLLAGFALSSSRGDARPTGVDLNRSPTAVKSDHEPRLIESERFRNDSFGAYSTALEEGKYAVILFHVGKYDPFSRKLLAKMHDPRLAKYSDRLRFSYTDEDRDEGAKQLVEALGVVRYPTLVVLRTNSENLHVAGRIEGEVSVSEIDRVLGIAMKQPLKKQAKVEPSATTAPARVAPTSPRRRQAANVVNRRERQAKPDQATTN